jgi:hypothetical protein
MLRLPSRRARPYAKRGSQEADRQALYTEIIRANNLDMGNMGELQRLFANSWRSRSSPGWWIQLDDGQWSKK